MEEQRALLESVDPAEPDQPSVKFGFWYLSEKGPEREEKELNVPPWQGDRGQLQCSNCRGFRRTSLRFQAGRRRPASALARQAGHGQDLRDSRARLGMERVVSVRVRVRPGKSIRTHANYLARMVIDGHQSAEERPTPSWRLLVLEDTGELLSIDAKERAGRGLSRLLNAVHGLLGQGSRVLLLITTNEELGALHPAVTRPGRCASQIDSQPLSPTEAKRWLVSRQASLLIRADAGEKCEGFHGTLGVPRVDISSIVL